MEVCCHSLKKKRNIEGKRVKYNTKIQQKWWFYRTFLAYLLLFRAVIVVEKKSFWYRVVVPLINVSL